MPKDYDVNPKRDKRGLTKPQQVFVENVLEIGPVEAAKKAYPTVTDKSAGEMASRNMRNPAIVSSISAMADARGVKREDCLDAIARGLKEDNPKAYLTAAKLGLEVHKELGGNTILPVPVTKEQYIELCRTFWTEKPGQ